MTPPGSDPRPDEADGRQVPVAADDWGPYRGTIEERVSRCVEQLGRARRGVGAGDIPADRFYFHRSVEGLHEAVADLVWHGQDVERWLGECAGVFRPEGVGARDLARCALPAGHGGGHEAVPAEEPRDYVVSIVRALEERITAVGRRVRGAAGRTHRPVGVGAPFTPNRHVLAGIIEELEELSEDASTLATELDKLVDADAPRRPPPHQPMPGDVPLEPPRPQARPDGLGL